jgi:oligopeptidase A
MIAARNFQSALQMLRQIEFSLFDIRLHQSREIDSAMQIQAILDKVRADVSVVKTPAINRFQNGFSHIFAGGYAAGYYSYKWAEVLSADAFAAFEEGFLIRKPGKDFCAVCWNREALVQRWNLFVVFVGVNPKSTRC